MAAKSKPVRQAGALAFHDGRICLVTSRSGKRWVIPKGRLEDGKSAREIVLQEAWEEAGLVGVLGHGPIGHYEYRKAGRTHVVAVYIMHVTAVKGKWPEQHRRERKWMSLEKAMYVLHIAELRRLLSVITQQRFAA